MWWIPVAAALGFFLFSPDGVQRGEDGRIIRITTMSVHDLLVGDCFDMTDGSIDEDGVEQVDIVTGIPCDSPHEYEVFHIAVLQPGPHPTQFRFDRVFDGDCLLEFENYVGTQWELSDIWADMFWPTEEGWNDGDHSVTCFLFDLDGPVTGSLRNSFR